MYLLYPIQDKHNFLVWKSGSAIFFMDVKSHKHAISLSHTYSPLRRLDNAIHITGAHSEFYLRCIIYHLMMASVSWYRSLLCVMYSKWYILLFIWFQSFRISNLVYVYCISSGCIRKENVFDRVIIGHRRIS